MDELNGEGVFKKYVGDGIVGILGLLELDSSMRKSSKNTIVNTKKSFVEALLNANTKDPKTITKNEDIVPLKPITNPIIAGGNIVVEVDDEEYHSVVEELKFCVIGKFNIQRGDSIPTTMEIQKKLSDFWKIMDFKVIPIGKRTFHILLCSMKDQCKALSVSPVFLKPGILRLNNWVPGYNLMKQGSILQVWIHIHNLPLEFHMPQNLFNITWG